MEITLSFQQVILNPFLFSHYFDSGYEKKRSIFITCIFKDVILKDQSVLLSVWFHAHFNCGHFFPILKVMCSESKQD